MALTPERIAELERLKAMMQPLATDAQRKAQAIWNAEQAAKAQVLGKANGGLAKFLEESKIKDRMYHATHGDFNSFRNNHRGIHFVTPSHEFADDFLTNSGQDDHEEGANIMPVHVHAKNPFDYQNKKHVNALATKASLGKLGIDQIKKGDWNRIEDRTTLKAIKDLGHDAVYVNEGGVKNLGVFHPHQIKSAIGNQGTYNLTNPDITKAKGGTISQDAMRLALMNKPHHFAQGGSEPRNWAPGHEEKLKKQLKSILMPVPAEVHPEAAQRLGIDLEDVQRRRPHALAINQWLERNFGNYVKKQMATETDPVRLQAETGVHGFPMAADPSYWARKGETRRKISGGKQVGQSDLAKHWENKTDAMIEAEKAQEHQDMMHLAPGMYSEKDEWIKKLDPETKLWSLTEHFDPRDLGIDHIRDVLHEDLMNNRIRPEQLSKISMAQAVKRAHEYDQEMEKRRQETAIKTTNDMPMVHDFPETGMKWIELTAPKPELQSGHVMGRPSGYPDLHAVMDEKTGQSVSHGATPEEAMRLYKRKEREQVLAEALKYEGDTMGHCVGGYCPDVLEGRSRIFSLRDKKGEPHVTVEVQPHGAHNQDAIFHQLMEKLGRDPTMEEFQSAVTEVPPRIVQIKGKGNAKPHKKYIPHVQHFVKSGNWSDVGDLHNTDLVDVKKYVDPTTHAKYLEHKLDVPKYATEKELEDVHNQYLKVAEPQNYKAPQPIKKAQGGNVQPSIAQMRMALTQNKFPSQAALSNIGAEEAPNMPVKEYVPPAGGQDGQLPVGGIDMSNITPGMQYMPEEQQAMQPPGQPGQPAPQGPSPLSAGPSAPGQQSNILQMTPQGQAMAAMRPQQGAVKPQMAIGGPVSSLPTMLKQGGTDGNPMDNGATTFSIDDTNLYAEGGSAKKPTVQQMKDAIFQKAQEGLMKPSEALGKHEGKYLHITEADRAKVEKRKHGMRGGVGFSQIGLEDPDYEGRVWGVGKSGTAIKLLNRERRGLSPEDESVWSTFIGTPDMHTSNQLVFNRMWNKFQEARKAGLLSPEQEQQMLDIMRSAMTKPTKKSPPKPIFESDVNLNNTHHLFDTFERRRLLSDLMAGKGVGGKKGQIFDASKMIEDTTDPRLLHAPSLSVGPHVFSFNRQTSHEPNLNKAFPFMLHGTAHPEAFQQIPFAEAAPDFTNEIRQTKGREPGYMDIVRRIPRQHISEKYLTGLQKMGRKKGGKVSSGKLSDNLDTMRLALTKKKAK